MENEDLWVWKESDVAEFSVKSAYSILKGEEQGEVPCMYEGFWRIEAQPSAHLIAWRVLEDEIATKVNMTSRRILLESSICSMCGEEAETTSHLFCTCKIAWLVVKML